VRRRRFVIGLVAATLLVGLPLRQAQLPPAAAGPLRALCGSERWSVKTFTDPDRFKVKLTPLHRTIKQLNALVKPATRPANGRVPAELKVYRVVATAFTTINEDDGDIHLAVRSSDGSEMIAEAPEPACSVGARDRKAVNAARLVAQDVQWGDKVVAVGVGFFDFAHNQTGHADNYIELHPLISLKRL
jgi:hypothetical protein